MADEQAGLNGLAEADFVGEKEAWWPVVVKALEGANLVGPRLHVGSGLADAFAAIGHFGGLFDEGPDETPQVEGRFWRWGRRGRLERELDRRCDLEFLEAGRKVVFRQEAEQVITEGIGNGHGDDVLGLTGPEFGEVGFLGGDAGVVTQPGAEDVEAFPVLGPAGFRFVEAAVEGESVAGFVFNDSGFFVKDALGGNGAAVFVARDSDLHFEDLIGDHPGEQFERLDFALITGLERVGEEMGFDLGTALGTLGDGVNLGLVERASDQKTHSA